MSERTARWFPWSLVGLYIVLSIFGMYLQSLSHTYILDLSFLLVIFHFLTYGVYLAIGALIASRRPQNPIGWIMCIAPIVTTIDLATFGYAYYGLVAHPGSLPAAGVLAMWLTFSGRPFGMLSLTLILLLFPNGRPLSARWRIVVWISIAVFALHVLLAVLTPGPIQFFDFTGNPLGVSETVWTVLSPLKEIVDLIVLLSLLAALLSLILRFRWAGEGERLQIKWIVYTLASTVTFLMLNVALGSGLPISTTLASLNVLNMFVGLSIGIAILRYRLWDIDVIIRRTLQYALLIGILALIYFGAVVLIQSILSSLTGSADSPFITVLSTLAIAALFNPLRRRVQDFIDRRFFRAKYDAEQTLSQFAATARDEVDLGQLSDTLLGVVEDTLQPESLSLWLKEE